MCTSAFIVLFLASDRDTTGKGSLSKDGWFPYTVAEGSLLLTHLKTWKQNGWKYTVTLLTLVYNKKTVAVDHWGESKRHFFCKALNVRSVLLICWIWSMRKQPGMCDWTTTLQAAEQCPANFALNSGAWNFATPHQPTCLVKVVW